MKHIIEKFTEWSTYKIFEVMNYYYFSVKLVLNKEEINIHIT